MYTQPTDQPANPTAAQPGTTFDPAATVAHDAVHAGTTVYPNAAYAAPAFGAYPAADPTDGRSSNRGLAIVVGVLVALLFLGGGVVARQAFSSSPPSAVAAPAPKATVPVAGPGSTVAPSTSIEVPEVPVTTAPALPTSPAPKSGGTGGGAPQPTNPPAPPAPQPPAAPKPAITSFTTPETIDCHNGNFQEFTASWTTTNATKVSISIDGPGVYKYYPANGSDSLPFTCTSAHSFMLTAYGADGSTVSTTITLQPRNVQLPEAPGADDE